MGRLKISVNYPIYRIKKSINISHGGDQSGSNRTIRKYHDSAGAAPAAECNTENRNGQHGCEPNRNSGKQYLSRIRDRMWIFRRR